MTDSADNIAAGRIAQVQASAGDVATGEAIAGASQKAALATGAALASKGGWLGLATFAAGVGGAYLGAKIAAATHADELLAKGLEAVGMHRIGVPTAPDTAPGGHNAARMGDAIAHSFALGGFLAAIAVAVAVSVLVVATAGVGAVALIGAAAAGGLVGGFLGAALGGALGSMGARTGVILSGSPNVFINGKPAARMTDMAKCAKEPPPVAIVEGNPTVFVNSLPLARIGHKLMCGAVVDEGSPNVFAGEETVQCATPEPEIPVTLRVLADWMFFVPLGKVVGGMGRQRAATQSSQTKGANPCGKRTCDRDPVDVATGEWIEVRLDLDVPGVLPLQLRRVYASGLSEGPATGLPPGLFGPGWSDSFHVSLLRREAGEIEYWDEEGASWVFDTPTERLNAAHLHQPHWRLIGTQQQPILHDRRANQKSHFTWHGHRARLSRVEDAYGNHYTLHYLANGQLDHIEHSAGYRVELARPSETQLSLLLHDQGAPVVEIARYQFESGGVDSALRLVRCQSEFSGQTYYRYAPNHRCIEWGDASHTRVTLEYQADGRVCAVQTPNNIHAGELEYDTARRETRVWANGQMTLYRYNADNLVTEIINPLGQTSRTAWYANGLKRSQLDIAGRNTTFIYNEQGLLQVVRAPEGETTLAYDDYAHCTKLTAPDGREWHWQYNEQGSLAAAQSPTGTEQFSFDEEGLLQSHQQQGKTTRFDYDDWQRPCLAIAPNGAMTHWQQSRLGRLDHHIDANGSLTRFEYEHGTGAPRKGLHLAPLAIIQANGDTQRFEYDQEGLLRKSTNAAGQSQRFEWGPYDLLLAHIDAAGQRYQYQYDHEARLIQVINPLNQHWQYAFDAAGQLRQERDFAGRIKQYEYSAEGLLATKIAPDGSKTRYQYDGSQRLTQITSDDCQIQYAYNTAQRLERATVYRAGQLESELIWTYDEAGRVSANVQDQEGLSWHYNEHNQCESRSMPMGSSSYYFDHLGLLASLRTRHGELHIERDKLGCDIRRSSLPQTDWQAMVAGSASFAAHFQLQQQFDSQHRLKAQQLAGQIPDFVHQRAEFGTPLRHYRWQQGRLTDIDDPRMGNTRYSLDARDQIARTDYDEGNRNLDAHPRTRLNDTLPQQLAQESFTYDAAGDIAMCDEAKPGQLHAPTQARMQHMHPGGVVRERGRYTYTHDTCGRMVARIEHQHGFRPRTTHFTWDGFDRLIEVHASDGSRWKYTYDALGRRTSKRCTHAAKKSAYSMLSNDLQEERYLWEGARLAQQSKRYADGTQEFFGWHYAPDSFTPLAVSHQKNQDEARLLYVVTDHLGTPRELLDGDGRMVWAAQLQTWGKLNRLWQTPAANDADNPLQLDLRFPNQWHDAESGLHYNYQRYYDPESGQYLSPDPIGMAGGMRSQGYVDNPSVWIDPLGLNKCGVEKSGSIANVVARGVKPINLPSWRKVTVDMVHVAERHMTGGARTAGKSVFVGLNERGVMMAIKQAYGSATTAAVQGERVLLSGMTKTGIAVEMWFNKTTNLIETAYPVVGR